MTETLNHTQNVIDYIECHMFDTNMQEIPRITGIPLSLYQRLFSYLCGISINGYIRQRRLTIAASQIISKTWTVTDASLECGYENVSSFSRAFKEQFKISPTLIDEQHYTLHQTDVIDVRTLSNYHIVNGKVIDATLVSIEYRRITRQKLIGISSKQYNVIGSELWDVYWDKGINLTLGALETVHESCVLSEYIAVGYMTGFRNSSELGNSYMIGRLYDESVEAPAGLTSCIIEADLIVHARIEADSLSAILDAAYFLISDAIAKNGYTISYDPFYWIEYYDSNYLETARSDSTQQIALDFYMPCVRINTNNLGGIR